MHKLSALENNDYTVKLLDVFVNRSANGHPDRFTTVCMVMEYLDFDMS